MWIRKLRFDISFVFLFDIWRDSLYAACRILFRDYFDVQILNIHILRINVCYFLRLTALVTSSSLFESSVLYIYIYEYTYTVLYIFLDVFRYKHSCDPVESA